MERWVVGWVGWLGWGGLDDDKGLVVQRCRGPSVFLIGPICLWQADLRRRKALEYDGDFLHVQRSASESGGMCLVPVEHEAEALPLSPQRPRWFHDHQPLWVVWLKILIHLLLFFGVVFFNFYVGWSLSDGGFTRAGYWWARLMVI